MGRSFLENLLRQSGFEATEEGISYAANYIADKAAGDPNASFSVQELVETAAAGGLGGSAVGFGVDVANTRNAIGTNQDIVSRVNQRLSASGQVMSDGLPLPTAGQADESIAKDTTSAKKTGTYRAEQPQNVDLPAAPIINLSMDRVAKLNDGTLPKSGNYLRKQAYSDTGSRLGLDKNEAAYVEAENITRNGDRYVIKITKPSLKKCCLHLAIQTVLCRWRALRC